jgi:hypothetical protein
VEFVFGNLVDKGESEDISENLQKVKKEFEDFGIFDLNLIQGREIKTYLFYVESLRLNLHAKNNFLGRLEILFFSSNEMNKT